MSTDAFAAAVAKGAALRRADLKEAVHTGAIFGCIETATPLIGWELGVGAAKYVSAFDHWIAFTLLTGLGLHMIYASRKIEETQPARPARHSFRILAATGLGTSIDAMAVGVSLAFIDVNIVPVALSIGAATFVMVAIGVMLGRALCIAIGRRAELAGGIVIVFIGSLILFEHLTG